jgi:hypothetical protein
MSSHVWKLRWGHMNPWIVGEGMKDGESMSRCFHIVGANREA